MDITQVRKRILVALFSDDSLMDQLVLKGGNALALVHEVGQRASVDLDFSMEARFADVKDARRRIFESLRNELLGLCLVLFDEVFEQKPAIPGQLVPDWWGGYIVKFKLASQALVDKVRGDFNVLRRQSEVLGPNQQRVYTIDISHNEYCEPKVRREIDDYVIYVYSLAMIVIEKLRAICQQMPEYPLVRHKRPRARDFYDICSILHDSPEIELTSPANVEILREIFAVKKVPLHLLGEIGTSREFHSSDWDSVTAAISGSPHDFDHYFDEVLLLVEKLKPFWNE